jgi:deoxyribose-phosphate aldolase
MLDLLNFNSILDYTLLDLAVSNEDIKLLCSNAQKLKVASVCVRPDKVTIAKKELNHSEVLVCTVVSFPSGENTIEEKINETLMALQNGADEIDVVINYKKINDPIYLKEELDALVRLCHSYKNKLSQPTTLKVIVESGLHTHEEVRFLTHLCINADVDYIKTSTGMVNVGAEIEKVKAMSQIIQDFNSALKIKASGGIRTMDQMIEFFPFVNRFGIGYQTVNLLNGRI